MASKIKIDKEKRDVMITEIKKFFLDERDEEIGDLAAGMLLDFFIEKLGPDIYNQGIYDSYKYISERTEDILELQKY